MGLSTARTPVDHQRNLVYLVHKGSESGRSLIDFGNSLRACAEDPGVLKALVFYGSLGVAGAVFAIVGGVNLTGEIVGPGSVLMSLGGLGIVLYSGYTIVRGDPVESVPDDSWVAATAVGAALLALWAVTVSPV